MMLTGEETKYTTFSCYGIFSKKKKAQCEKTKVENTYMFSKAKKKTLKNKQAQVIIQNVRTI